MKETGVLAGDLRHKAVLLVGHRLSSDRRTAFDWALGMFDPARYYIRFSKSLLACVLPGQSVSLCSEVHTCGILGVKVHSHSSHRFLVGKAIDQTRVY